MEREGEVGTAAADGAPPRGERGELLLRGGGGWRGIYPYIEGVMCVGAGVGNDEG